MTGRSAPFDQFWAAYPRKVGKDAARKVWAKRKLNPLIDMILLALEWQRTQPAWTKDDGAFIPHPATWIRQGRWQDEPPAVPVRRCLGGHEPACTSTSDCTRKVLNEGRAARGEPLL